MVSEVIALRMNKEVAGQLHSNTIAIQDAQAARIWELEKQVDGMGLLVHKMRKRQDTMATALEECQHQSVMCQALLTHYVESHWVPIGALLEQIGSRSSCGLFPPAPHYCDLHDVKPVVARADGSSSPASLPSLESVSSSSINSVYYTPAFLQGPPMSSPIPLLSGKAAQPPKIYEPLAVFSSRNLADAPISDTQSIGGQRGPWVFHYLNEC